MNLKISSVCIECRSGNVYIPFSDSITVIYGNTGVGKTTLLNLISYALGNTLIKTLAVEKEVTGVKLTLTWNGEIIISERKMNSNSMFLTSRDREIHLAAKKTTASSRQTISEYFYQKEEIEPILMLRKNSSKEYNVTFSNYMWFSYLKQDELDSSLFYFNEEKNNIKFYASAYVLKVLLNNTEVIDKEIRKKINMLRERQELYSAKVSVAKEILAESSLFNADLSQKIASRKKETLTLREKMTGANSERVTLEDYYKLGCYETELKYLREFSRIKEISTIFNREKQRCIDEINYYEDQLDNSENDVFHNNLDTLGDVFKECLVDVRFSYLEPEDIIRINQNNFMPVIYSKDGEYKFDYSTLSSGGKKTIFKICYALAIHIYVKRNHITSLLPQFMIIDTPMKNISEREDKELFENLYKFFYKLFSSKGVLCNEQLIIVDKEKSAVFSEKDIMVKHYTSENPLINYRSE